MDEPEIKIYYQPEWMEEWKRDGLVRLWGAEFPELAEGSCGTPAPFAGQTGYGFVDSALMYLLRKQQGFHSITYFRIAAISEDPAVKHLHSVLHQWMGNDVCEKLQRTLRDAGFWGHKGEPDLFCWHPVSGKRFFAEAKGKGDTLKGVEKSWFEVCRNTIPEIDIRVYRVLPETAETANQAR